MDVREAAEGNGATATEEGRQQTSSLQSQQLHTKTDRKPLNQPHLQKSVLSSRINKDFS